MHCMIILTRYSYNITVVAILNILRQVDNVLKGQSKVETGNKVCSGGRATCNTNQSQKYQGIDTC